jgi:hypothetical protein
MCELCERLTVLVVARTSRINASDVYTLCCIRKQSGTYKGASLYSIFHVQDPQYYLCTHVLRRTSDDEENCHSLFVAEIFTSRLKNRSACPSANIRQPWARDRGPAKSSHCNRPCVLLGASSSGLGVPVLSTVATSAGHGTVTTHERTTGADSVAGRTYRCMASMDSKSERGRMASSCQ